MLGEQELRRILGRCLSGEEGKEVCGGSFETKFKLKQAGKKAVQVWNDKYSSALKFNGWGCVSPPAESVWGQMVRAWTTDGRNAPRTTKTITEDY